MSYEAFKTRIKALIERAGGGINVRFSEDEESGKHFAKCSDGTVIIGNRTSLKVSVHWNGTNHQALVTI